MYRIFTIGVCAGLLLLLTVISGITYEIGYNTDNNASSTRENTEDDNSNIFSMQTQNTDIPLAFLTDGLTETGDLHIIPEKSWPDSNRIRRELTQELAIQYPQGNFIPRSIENAVWESENIWSFQ